MYYRERREPLALLHHRVSDRRDKVKDDNEPVGPHTKIVTRNEFQICFKTELTVHDLSINVAIHSIHSSIHSFIHYIIHPLYSFFLYLYAVIDKG